MNKAPVSHDQPVYTVSLLNQEAKALLEAAFPALWIEGEISNFTKPASGHWYFSLKDANAQVRCAMFTLRNRQVNFKPENGQHVLLRAKISLYEGRGDFQLIVEQMELAGSGALQRAFEALKQRLSQEGLFDTSRKLPLPSMPRCIGVITSTTGAAIRDVLSVLKRRFPSIPVVIYPTAVQGGDAKGQICNAIARANENPDCDVLLLVRGGGSLEDLWSFNEECVARAICASKIPIVSGVGHEIDFTIADFAASQRAPTPSVAAEMVTPDRVEWLQHFEKIKQRVFFQIRSFFNQQQQLISWLQKRLKHPGQRLQEQAQQLDQIEIHLRNYIKHCLQKTQLQTHTLISRLQKYHPQPQLHLYQQQLQNSQQRLTLAMAATLKNNQQKAQHLYHSLETVSPLATLNRGYAIATKDEQILRRANEVQITDEIKLRLHQGALTCQVMEINSNEA